MLNDNEKQLCLQSVAVFNEILSILRQYHPCEYSYEIATELTKIVFMAVADV